MDDGIERPLVDGEDVFDLAALIFGDGGIFLAFPVEERDLVSLSRHARGKLFDHDLHTALPRGYILMADHYDFH